jgi:hypothetical protein
MKILILLFGLLAWVGSCVDDTDLSNPDAVEVDATWTNMLAADGCSWHFSVSSKDTSYSLVPDDSSISKIESSIGKMEGYYSLTDVHLKYTLTGNKKEILCGWGHKAIYDEIKVLSVSKK